MKRIVSVLCAMALGVGLLASCSTGSDAESGVVVPGSGKSITSYTFQKSLNSSLDQDYSATWNSVSRKWVVGPLSAKTDVTALIATFSLSDGATAKIGSTAQISGTTKNDFSSEVSYAVSAADGSTASYTVSVLVNSSVSAEAKITAFSLTNGTSSWTGTIDEAARTIAVAVDSGTAVTALIASFTASAGAGVKVGQAAQTSGSTANDFTSPVTYSVTAEDGTTIVPYAVTVTVAAPAKSTEAKITAFSLAPSGGSSWTGEIDEANKIIAVPVSYGTAVTALIATFTLSNGATAKIGTTAQASGTTSNNFTYAVTYKVTAEDGTTGASYTVKVAAPGFSTLSLSAGSVKAFGATDLTTIAVALPSGTDLSSLVATWTSAVPLTVAIGATALTSGSTAADYSSPVSLTLTASNGATASYTLTAVTAPVGNYAFPYGDMSSPVENSYGLKPTGTLYETVTGHDGTDSLALHVKGTTTATAFVFTSKYSLNPKGSYSKISFWVKGTTTSSAATPKVALSFQIGPYDSVTSANNICFPCGVLTADATIAAVTAHAYTGSVNTSGNWVKVTLDISGSSTDGKAFYMKVGTGTCDFYVDDFIYE